MEMKHTNSDYNVQIAKHTPNSQWVKSMLCYIYDDKWAQENNMMELDVHICVQKESKATLKD